MKRILIFICLLFTFVTQGQDNQTDTDLLNVYKWIVYQNDTLVKSYISGDTLFTVKGAERDTLLASTIDVSISGDTLFADGDTLVFGSSVTISGDTIFVAGIGGTDTLVVSGTNYWSLSGDDITPNTSGKVTINGDSTYFYPIPDEALKVGRVLTLLTNGELEWASPILLYNDTQDSLAEMVTPSTYTTWLRNGDTIYNDSTVVKLNNWLMTDYITSDATNENNTILGYEAFTKDARAGDVSDYSTFIGWRAGYDSDTIASSSFIGAVSGNRAHNITNSFIGGYGSGEDATNITDSDIIGGSAGDEADSINKSTLLGYMANRNGNVVNSSVIIGSESASTANHIDSSLLIGFQVGTASSYINKSTFIGNSVGAGASNISDQLWIDNTNTTDPLIRGFFANDSLVINGNLTVTGLPLTTGKDTAVVIEDGILYKQLAGTGAGDNLGDHRLDTTLTTDKYWIGYGTENRKGIGFTATKNELKISNPKSAKNPPYYLTWSNVDSIVTYMPTKIVEGTRGMGGDVYPGSDEVLEFRVYDTVEADYLPAYLNVDRMWYQGGSGDVNTSYSISATDALGVLTYLRWGNPMADPYQADVDGDGFVTMTDAEIIQTIGTDYIDPIVASEVDSAAYDSLKRFIGLYHSGLDGDIAFNVRAKEGMRIDSLELGTRANIVTTTYDGDANAWQIKRIPFDSITANITESDPVWISDSATYISKSQAREDINDSLAANTQGFLTVEADPVWISDSSTYISKSQARSDINDSLVANSQGFLTAEVDGSTTNEGALTVTAGGSNDSKIVSNTAGDNAVIIKGTSNITVEEADSTITIGLTALKVPKYWIGVDTTAINTTDKFYIGYTPAEIVLDTLVFSMNRNAGSPDVTVKLWYGSNMNAAGTAVVTAGNQITTYAGQTKITSFDNGTLPAGTAIWATFSAVSVRPKGIFLTLIGH